MSGNRVLTEVVDNIAFLKLNSPPAHCLSSAMIEDLNTAFNKVSSGTGMRCIVITAEGDRFFALGADINEVAKLDASMNRKLVARVGEVLNKILISPIPTVAAINGSAMGGGLELTLHCDFRICTEGVKFGLPEINLGLIPGAGGIQLLPRLIGLPWAKRLLYTGEVIDARNALAIGLVDQVVPDNQTLRGEVMKIGSLLASKAPLAYRAVKKALLAGMEKSYSDARKEDVSLFAEVCVSADKQEGINAFLEKRKPVYTGQ